MSKYKVAYFIILLLMGLAGLSITLYTVLSVAIGWDSPTDTNSFLEISSISSSSTLKEAYDSVFFTSEFYGIVVQQTSMLLECLLTGNCQFPAPLSAETYIWQGIVSTLLLGISAIFLASSAALILKSRLTGAFIWAFYLSLPVVSGLSAIDYKDAPLASGLIIYCSGISLVWYHKSTRKFLPNILSVLTITFGGFISLASRPASWIILLAIGLASMVYFIISWLAKKRISGTRLFEILISIIASSLAALIPLFFTNPLARISLLRWLLDSYLVMSNYPMETGILVAGKIVTSTNLPWWYVPVWILAQTPLPSLLFLAFSALTMLVFLAGRQLSFFKKCSSLIPFAILGLGIPLATFVAGSSMYDGIRHSFYIFGPLAIIAGIGFAYLRTIISGYKKIRNFLYVFVLVAIGINLVETISWSPYQYSYLNSIAVSLRENPSWETDYWGISQKEAMNKFEELGVENVFLFGIMPNTQPIYGTLTGTPNRGDGIYYISRGGSETEIPNNCSRVFEITRYGQNMGVGYLCN